MKNDRIALITDQRHTVPQCVGCRHSGVVNFCGHFMVMNSKINSCERKQQKKAKNLEMEMRTLLMELMVVYPGLKLIAMLQWESTEIAK